MFTNLESFSIFFFISLALIVLAIAFEDKLVALEKKYDKRKSGSRAVRKPVSHSTGSSVRRASANKSLPASFQTEKRTRKTAA